MFVVFGLLTLLLQFVNAQYTATTFAGTGTSGWSGDGGPATSADVYFVAGVWVDTNGVTFFVDYSAYVLRKVDTSGIITTIGGTNSMTISNSGGAFTSVPLYYPWGVVGDSTYLYVSDNYHIWKYTRSTGIVSILAGTGTLGVSGDGGPAVSAEVNKPCGLWLTTGNILYLVEYGSHLVRKVTLSNNIISTVAGIGTAGNGGDGESPLSTNTKFNAPQGIYVDTNGVIFIADRNNNRIRYIQNNILNTYAGGGVNTGTGFAATSSYLNTPFAVTGDSIGNIFVVEGGDKIKVVDYQTKIVSIYLSGLISPRAIWLDRVNSRTVIGMSNFVRTAPLYSNPVSAYPTADPTMTPTRTPTVSPTRVPTRTPSAIPTTTPSMIPTMNPTASPSKTPTIAPTVIPTTVPSDSPSVTPTVTPSAVPTTVPSISPSATPTTTSPSASPTTSAPSTISPSAIPSYVPTMNPTEAPTMVPTAYPTAAPSRIPTATPSFTPTAVPTPSPTPNPTMVPSSLPTIEKDEIVQVVGVSRVKFVNGETLNSLSLSTLLTAFQNISENAQSTEISSTVLIAQSQVQMIPHRQNVRGRVSLAGSVRGSSTYDIGFVSTYLTSHHQGYTSSQLASAKSTTIRQAIEGGEFESALRSLAVARNATQLLNGTCNEVTSLSSTITASSSSSSSESNVNVTVIIIIVVCVAVGLLCLCGGLFFYRKRYMEERNRRKVYVENAAN